MEIITPSADTAPDPSLGAPLNPVVLTPNSTLIFPFAPGDWREALFELAAKRQTAAEPAIRFWRSLSESFLAKLCRLPDDKGP